jgi:hypothetical protein
MPRPHKYYPFIRASLTRPRVLDAHRQRARGCLHGVEVPLLLLAGHLLLRRQGPLLHALSRSRRFPLSLNLQFLALLHPSRSTPFAFMYVGSRLSGLSLPTGKRWTRSRRPRAVGPPRALYTSTTRPTVLR